jgi:hypothetical protein
MSPIIKNIATILVALSLAFLGYYLYSQNKNANLSFDGGIDSTQQMLTNTQIFIERRTLLDQVKLDTDIFMDPIFQSYRSYRSPDVAAPVGRPNPFEANTSSGI